MKKVSVILALLLVAIMAISLSACGGASEKSAMDTATADYMPAPAVAEPRGPVDSGYGYDMAMEEMGMTEDASLGGTGSFSATVDGSKAAGRKITFTASYSIETKRFDEDYDRIVTLANSSEGYIAYEDTDSHSYYSGAEGRSSYFSLRVPVAKFDTFLEALEGIGDVVNKNKSSQDLTSEYFDTEARIELLEMRKERLMEYIETATEPEVIIEFEREYSNVLYELDSYEGNKRRLDNLVDYATVDVNLHELITAETIGKDGEPLGDRAQDAFSLSINGVKNFLKNAVVFLAGAVPVIVLIVIIVVIILLIRKLVLYLVDRYNTKYPDKVQRKREFEDRRLQAKMQKKQRRQNRKNPHAYMYTPPQGRPMQQPVPPQSQAMPQQQPIQNAQESPDTEPKA